PTDDRLRSCVPTRSAIPMRSSSQRTTSASGRDCRTSTEHFGYGIRALRMAASVCPMTRDAEDIVYDRIGHGYRAVRRSDPRLAEQIWRALGDSHTVLNAGAGTGYYEP